MTGRKPPGRRASTGTLTRPTRRRGSFTTRSPCCPASSSTARIFEPAPSIPHHHQPVGAAFAAPRFARPAEHLAHARAALVAREAGERLAPGIELHDRVGDKIGEPDPVA